MHVIGGLKDQVIVGEVDIGDKAEVHVDMVYTYSYTVVKPTWS